MEAREFIALRIKELRTKKLAISGAKLGELLVPPISGKTVSSWERCRTQPDAEALIQLSQIFSVPISYFYPPSLSNGNDFSSEIAYNDVPLYGSIAAGKPLAIIPIENTHPIPIEMHKKYPEAFLLRVEGESMNKILPNGALALVDPKQTDPIDEAVYAFCVNNDDATIKRVRKLAYGFEMLPDSDDPTFKPVVYDKQNETPDNITIIGRVVWMMPPFDWTL